MFYGRQLQILAQPLYFLNEEVDIRLGSGWVGDDHPEEVGLVPLRLVANHGRARLHHQGFDFRGHLVRENTKQNSRLIYHALFQNATHFLVGKKSNFLFITCTSFFLG